VVSIALASRVGFRDRALTRQGYRQYAQSPAFDSLGRKATSKENVGGMKEQEQDLEATEEQGLVDAQTGEEAPAEPVPAETEEGEADEVSVLLQELEEAKRREAEYLDGWQRARAELANARKRFQREQEQAYAGARGDVLVRMLPVVDDFERAFATLPEEMAREEPAWLGGIRLIWRKLQSLLQQERVTPIETAGQEFDPYLHQAVTHEPSETVPEGHIIDEMQKGYQMDGRVLRPSIVRVSCGPPKAPAALETADQGQEAETCGTPEEGNQDAAGEEPSQMPAGGRAEAQDTGGPRGKKGSA
jgi:molecular chaperone GrpE